MTLDELKKPYEKNFNHNLKNKLDTELVDMYLSTNYSNVEKDQCIANLICNSWYLLQRMYYKNQANLSMEDCYDIFIQTFHYVVGHHVWDKETSSLYQDKEAFIKAMAITLECRRKNFLKAKFRDKRILNAGSLSLDELEEVFSDGYFSAVDFEEPTDAIDKSIEERISYYLQHKCYLPALILEAVLYNNVYDSEGNFDYRRLKKYLRNLTPEFKSYIIEKYGGNLDELNEVSNYNDMTVQRLDNLIRYSFMTLRHDKVIQKILNK